MAIRKGAEIHIIVNKEEGVSCVQIVGPTGTHREAHDLYFKILDLVQNFDKTIQDRIKEGNEGAKSNRN